LLIKSFAKINLFLNIIGRNQNNYHLLESLFCFCKDIYDEISINIAKQNSFSINGEFAAPLLQDKNENLIIKAVKSLSTNNQYKIKLTKNIPIAAGLGGGSGNAAQTLKHLIQLEHNKLNVDEINNICLKIGADVPACYLHQAAIVEGIGEKVTPFNKLPKLLVLLVNPQKYLSTKEIFQSLKGQFSHSCLPFPEFECEQDIIEFIKLQHNDLANPAMQQLPIINEIIQKLKKQSGCIHANMSGSGPTCFGIFIQHAEIVNAQQNLMAIYPNFWIKSSELC
jgi:4-diphosphocytidyl-2-C-methyl-D-erythritol kinase